MSKLSVEQVFEFVQGCLVSVPHPVVSKQMACLPVWIRLLRTRVYVIIRSPLVDGAELMVSTTVTKLGILPVVKATTFTAVKKRACHFVFIIIDIGQLCDIFVLCLGQKLLDFCIGGKFRCIHLGNIVRVF